MATRNFAGVNDDWESVSNWTVPVPNDDVIIRNSSQSLAQNLDQTGVGEPGESGSQLTSLVVARDYTGNIGGTGNPLRINAETARIFPGGKECWITGAFTEIHVHPLLREANAVVLGSQGTSDGENIDDAFFYGGRIVVPTNTKIENLYILPGDAFVLIETAGTGSIDYLYVDGGQEVEFKGACTNLINSGGIVRVTGGSVTNYDGQPGAKLAWEEGSITKIISRGTHHVDGTKHTAAATLTTLIALGGTTVDFRTGVNAITITNQTVLGGAKLLED